jgi:hypothetical protein
MDFGAILIGLAIFIVALIFTVNPLTNKLAGQAASGISPAVSTRNQQHDSLAAIRDLDFDFQTGKINQEDYDVLRSQFVAEAAEIIQKEKQEDVKIEEMIRARLQRKNDTVHDDKQPAFCSHCGNKVIKSDLFCSKCGTHLTTPSGS